MACDGSTAVALGGCVSLREVGLELATGRAGVGAGGSCKVLPARLEASRRLRQAPRPLNPEPMTPTILILFKVFVENASMNLNTSAPLNVSRLLFRPGLCLPHYSVSNFNDLPIPLDRALQKATIKAVVLDKDDCFAYPGANEVYGPYKVRSLS